MVHVWAVVGAGAVFEVAVVEAEAAAVAAVVVFVVLDVVGGGVVMRGLFAS